MSKLTKADLLAQNEELRETLRRTQRALNQIEIALPDLPEVSEADNRPSYSTDHTVEALIRARDEWERVVKDPSDRVNSYIRSAEGIGWSSQPDYIRNGQFAWCGAFAAFCYTSVKMNIRKKIFPSTYRMFEAWAKTNRRIAIDCVAPGDIVVIYAGSKKRWGDHITLCVNVCDGYIETIEGNAKGTLGDDTYGEGVIKQKRSFDKIAYVYRLQAVDFDE